MAQADEAPAGRFSLDLYVGPAVSLLGGAAGTVTATGQPLAFTSLRFGIALTADRRLRLLIAPELSFTQVSTQVPDPQAPKVIDTTTTQLFLFSLPIGLEYDIPIRRVPGLSVYPQLLVGYNLFATAFTGPAALTGGDTTGTAHNGMMAVSFGVRYVWRKRLDVAFEPFGLSVYGPHPYTLILYRALASVGVTF